MSLTCTTCRTGTLSGGHAPRCRVGQIELGMRCPECDCIDPKRLEDNGAQTSRFKSFCCTACGAQWEPDMYLGAEDAYSEFPRLDFVNHRGE